MRRRKRGKEEEETGEGEGERGRGERGHRWQKIPGGWAWQEAETAGKRELVDDGRLTV